MTRLWLAAPAALTLIAGAAMAQTSSETTTTTNTYVPVAPVVPVAPPVTQRTVQQRTVDSDGNVSERTMTTGTTVSPYGDTTTTRRTTETTTVR
jgi:hypothetical protein